MLLGTLFILNAHDVHQSDRGEGAVLTNGRDLGGEGAGGVGDRASVNAEQRGQKLLVLSHNGSDYKNNY